MVSIAQIIWMCFVECFMHVWYDENINALFDTAYGVLCYSHINDSVSVSVGVVVVVFLYFSLFLPERLEKNEQTDVGRLNILWMETTQNTDHTTNYFRLISVCVCVFVCKYSIFVAYGMNKLWNILRVHFAHCRQRDKKLTNKSK